MTDTTKRPRTRLYLARRAAGITQMELSARTGISQVLISNIERSAREGSADTYRKLAKVLGVSVSYLTGEQVQDWREGSGREELLKDPIADPGLQALARNEALCKALGIEVEAWAALRSLQSPHPLNQEAYLIVLHAIRGSVVDV